jgi:aminopeptidase N
VGYVGVPFKDGAMEHATNIALPQSYINGNTNNQITIAHELAHFWFGNLITCATSQNMWINEGFATFGEYLSYEALDPTLQKYNTEIKKLHFDVLKNDGGLYALDNVPTNATYSFTSYKKGGLVVHTLRNYMGDELHFNSIKQFLDENKYGNIDSKEFFEKLSQITKMDLNDFYLGKKKKKGFLNFNIDSIKLKIGSNNVYQVAFKQKLYQAEYFANSNKVDVEFVSASGEKKLVEKMQFSDVHEIVEIELPFEPVFWAIDPDEKMGSACFAHTQTITKTGTTSFSNTNFSINVSEIEGEAIIRVEHNPVAPTPAKSIPPNIFRVSEKHYWRIGFLQSSAMQAAYIFTYNTNTYDADLLQGYSQNDLLLLYRKDASHDWQIIPATIKTGTLTVDHLLPGEYTFGVGEEASVNEWENKIEVYPNPTTGELKITNYKLRITNVEVFDVFGKKREGIKARKHEGEIDVNISHLPVGSYFVQIQTDKGTITRKIIKN